MFYFPPTTIFRHRRENLKKCSLRGLEERPDFRFFTYPQDSLPDLEGYVILTIDAPLLSAADSKRGLFLIDGTWRYAARMLKATPPNLIRRSLPPSWKTAYPRRQDDCPDPRRGLASIEAIFAAYTILERDCHHLLDLYHWKDLFISENALTSGL